MPTPSFRSYYQKCPACSGPTQQLRGRKGVGKCKRCGALLAVVPVRACILDLLRLEWHAGSETTKTRYFDVYFTEEARPYYGAGTPPVPPVLGNRVHGWYHTETLRMTQSG